MRTTTTARRRTGRRATALASPLLAAVLLAGCAGGAAGEQAAGSVGSSAASSSEPSAPPSSAAPSSTPSATPSSAPSSTPSSAPAERTEPAGETPPAQEPPAEEPDGGSPDGGTEGLPGWPVESAPVHGGQYWAVYLAVGAPGDPALQQVLADVRQLWPGAALGELGCDAGAAEALGRDAGEHAVAVYFPTEQHVTEFRRRWESPFVGSARVTTLCGD